MRDNFTSNYYCCSKFDSDHFPSVSLTGSAEICFFAPARILICMFKVRLIGTDSLDERLYRFLLGKLTPSCCQQQQQHSRQLRKTGMTAALTGIIKPDLRRKLQQLPVYTSIHLTLEPFPLKRRFKKKRFKMVFSWKLLHNIFSFQKKGGCSDSYGQLSTEETEYFLQLKFFA